MVEKYNIRTDLALEEKERFELTGGGTRSCVGGRI